MKRQMDIVVLSDLHLGSYNCHANQLFQYLNNIETKILVLNGDILDTRQLKKRFFPKKHMEVIHLLLQMAINGTKVYYITGNHDDSLRQFSNLSMGKISVRDKLILQLKGEQYWIFHGDVLDKQKLISPLSYFFGKNAYDLLLQFNRWSNAWKTKTGAEQISFSEKIKRRFQKAQYYIQSFEDKAMELAAGHKYDYVICGHIHEPVIKTKKIKGQNVTYMNAGDWVESLTALEYRHDYWNLYKYDEMDYSLNNSRLSVSETASNISKDLLSEILKKGREDLIV